MIPVPELAMHRRISQSFIEAFESGDVETAAAPRALAEAGADLHQRDNVGRTPLDAARAADRQTAARELRALGAEESA